MLTLLDGHVANRATVGDSQSEEASAPRWSAKAILAGPSMGQKAVPTPSITGSPQQRSVYFHRPDKVCTLKPSRPHTGYQHSEEFGHSLLS